MACRAEKKKEILAVSQTVSGPPCLLLPYPDKTPKISVYVICAEGIEIWVAEDLELAGIGNPRLVESGIHCCALVPGGVPGTIRVQLQALALSRLFVALVLAGESISGTEGQVFFVRREKRNFGCLVRQVLIYLYEELVACRTE